MNDNMLITENSAVKFQVKLNGQVLTEAQSRTLAEQFVSTLSPEQRSNAQIVPITEGGQQILFG